VPTPPLLPAGAVPAAPHTESALRLSAEALRREGVAAFARVSPLAPPSPALRQHLAQTHATPEARLAAAKAAAGAKAAGRAERGGCCPPVAGGIGLPLASLEGGFAQMRDRGRAGVAFAACPSVARMDGAVFEREWQEQLRRAGAGLSAGPAVF